MSYTKIIRDAQKLMDKLPPWMRTVAHPPKDE